MIKKVSLIIPSKTNKFYLEDYLVGILFWACVPQEVIVVNTDQKIKINSTILKKYKKKKIQIKIINKKNLYPGQARNIGIKASKFKYLCFLDVNTVVYNSNWLRLNLNILNNKKIDGILGQTIYLSNHTKEKIIIGSTYGFKKLRTLPGSIIKKKIFSELGLFNNFTRAGEDTDWLLRIKKSKFIFLPAAVPIYYKGLYQAKYRQIIKKWFRNYYSSSNYKHLLNQKIIYLIVFLLSTFVVLIEIFLTYKNVYFSFEPLLMTFSKLFVYSYIIYRGFYLPLKKNVRLNFLLPINFIKILFFSFILDIVKTFSFILSIFNKFKKS